MNNLSHDFVTVDMRGLKVALVARARALQVSVSVLVRGAVERELGLAAAPPQGDERLGRSETSIVKLSIRLAAADAARLEAGAMREGLPRGAFIASLLSSDAARGDGSASRKECIGALVASSAELSTLSRSLHHLTLLLREGNAQAAQEYRPMLEALGADVRAHLARASGLLAELRPRRHLAQV